MFEHVVALNDIFVSHIVLVDNQYMWHCHISSLTLYVCVGGFVQYFKMC